MTQPQFLRQPLSAVILLGISATTAYAADEIYTKKMAPIVVTAQETKKSNGLIVIADPKQPIQPVPATDGADYLQSMMGFSSIKNGGTNGDVTFRGMFGSRIKILTDGTENLGACPGRMDAPTSYINPESYDRITVIKGPQTVQYANTGSAATVIFEREPPLLSIEQPYRGQASVLIGSYGRLDHNLEAAIGDDQKYVRINTNRSVSNDYQDGDGDRIHSSWERWNADLALGWKPTQDSWIELRGGKGDGEAAYATRGMDGTQFKRESLGLHIQQTNINPVIKKIEAQVDYNYNDHVMDNFRLRPAPVLPRASQVTRRTLNARTAITTEWDQLSIISGLDSQHNQHVNNTRRDLGFQSYGVFSEWRYALNTNNKLVAGARVDHLKFNNEINQQQRKETNPSGFIRIENSLPEHGLKTYAGLGYVERTPDYWELMRVSNNQLNYLNTEKTTQLDTGFELEHDVWRIWTSAYTGLINDFILLSYQNNKVLPARNVDAAIAGAEAGMSYQLSDHIQAELSGMYAWGKNTTDHKPLPQIAPLEGRLNLRYVEDKYSFGVLWRVVAKQDRISLNEGNIVGFDMGESKAFNTLALNAVYQFTDAFDLAVGIDNVLDKTYSEHLNKSGIALFGYAADEQINNIGRNYWARISMKF